MPRVAAVEVDVATVPDVVPETRSARRGSGGLSADRLEHADVPKLATATRPAVAIARQTHDRFRRITPPNAPNGCSRFDDLPRRVLKNHFHQGFVHLEDVADNQKVRVAIAGNDLDTGHQYRRGGEWYQVRGIVGHISVLRHGKGLEVECLEIVAMST